MKHIPATNVLDTYSNTATRYALTRSGQKRRKLTQPQSHELPSSQPSTSGNNFKRKTVKRIARNHIPAVVPNTLFFSERRRHVKCHKYFILVHVPCIFFLFFLLCTMTNERTIISQIITILHVSTLSCHPQGASTRRALTYRLYIQPPH